MPKQSAIFGLPGQRENIVRLDASHSDMCCFDGTNQRDKDNLKIVCSNLEDAYEYALKTCESVNDIYLPRLAPGAADWDLEDRFRSSETGG